MASTLEIILIEDVLKLGSMGDLVTVKAGYARNYLFPEGKAVPAGQAAKRQVEVLRERAKQNELEREGKAAALKQKIDGVQLEIAAKVAHDDVLFGSVGIRDIVRALSANGFEIDQKQVHLHENFKQLGSYEVLVKLHANVEATIKVAVVDSDPQGRSMDEVIQEVSGEEAVEEAEA